MNNFNQERFEIQMINSRISFFYRWKGVAATNDDAYENLIEIFGEEKVFDYSKPFNYVKYPCSVLYFDKQAIVLDSFAGSGTTGHSVLKLNEEDGGDRNYFN